MTNKYFFTLLILMSLSFSTNSQSADEADDARITSGRIMDLISGGNYAEVWDSHMSDFFQSSMTRDAFLANLTIGRQMLGQFVEGELIDMAYSDNDPQSGYQGSVYAFNYANTYSGLRMYERVVLIDEDGDGFKLAGFWANPAQQ